MTEACGRMLSGDDDETPFKCRERRRRRIEMRRLATASAAAGSPPPASQGRTVNRTDISGCEAKRIRARAEEASAPQANSSSSSSSEDAEAIASSPLVSFPGEGHAREPVFGTMSISGRSRDMEDAIAVRTGLCRPKISRRQPVHLFSVYDGHGGSHVAAMCRERLHVLIEEELMSMSDTRETEESVVGSRAADEAEEEEVGWSRVMKNSFKRMDEVAMNTCACGSIGGQCGCHPMEVALCGSTAVVCVLTPDHIVVANCGDSRAVLCRGGRAIPLSNDHKPDRADELARIEVAGGRVIFVNGARVEGILAMSRAIGDKYLKSVITSEPEVTFKRRQSEDECLILASDGLWDVLSSDLACEVACECLREGSSRASIDVNSGPRIENEGALYPSRSMLAAALLTRLALARKSSDNISVIVVDLKNS